VILDSSVLIEAERQGLNVARFLKHMVHRIGEMEAALCSITVAELAHGIYRADTSSAGNGGGLSSMISRQPSRFTLLRKEPPNWWADLAPSHPPRE